MTATGIRRLLLSGTAVVASIGAAGTAQAQTATTAGTVISNQAKASYTVNGQPATVDSNIATFVVDRKVNLTVVADPNVNTQVNLGQINAVTTFRVTNNTNGTQDMLLRADQNVGVGGTGTDNFDVTNVRIFLDTNGSNAYDAGDLVADYIDELAPDASALVFIVADVPNINTANYATVSLNAQVAAGGTAGSIGVKGAALTETVGLNSNTELDVVFADNDSDGLLGFDALHNGQGRAYLEYEVGARTVALSIVKTSSVVTDGVSVLNPKALPGATVQYCLTVQNNTPFVPASGINLTDVIPVNTTYVPGSIRVGGIGGAGVCVLGGFPVNDDGSPVLLSPYSGSFNTATNTVNATIPTLAGGTSLAVTFQVLIK